MLMDLSVVVPVKDEAENMALGAGRLPLPLPGGGLKSSLLMMAQAIALQESGRPESKCRPYAYCAIPVTWAKAGASAPVFWRPVTARL